MSGDTLMYVSYLYDEQRRLIKKLLDKEEPIIITDGGSFGGNCFYCDEFVYYDNNTNKMTIDHTDTCEWWQLKQTYARTSGSSEE